MKNTQSWITKAKYKNIRQIQIKQGSCTVVLQIMKIYFETPPSFSRESKQKKFEILLVDEIIYL